MLMSKVGGNKVSPNGMKLWQGTFHFSRKCAKICQKLCKYQNSFIQIGWFILSIRTRQHWGGKRVTTVSLEQCCVHGWISAESAQCFEHGYKYIIHINIVVRLWSWQKSPLRWSHVVVRLCISIMKSSPSKRAEENGGAALTWHATATHVAWLVCAEFRVRVCEVRGASNICIQRCCLRAEVS